jgi:hypothetical protein
MNSTSRCSPFNDYWQVISNTCKNAFKGGKCEGNSSCKNNQSYSYLSFIFHIQYFFREQKFGMYFFEYFLFQIKCFCFVFFNLYVFNIYFFMLNQCLWCHFGHFHHQNIEKLWYPRRHSRLIRTDWCHSLGLPRGDNHVKLRQ